ncbi:hypothetical protein [Nonomuraea sp. LPB2021202275-12-8]|uniref:hypothetical protein n=1 Tax=Nonomuraea sp. LPB2021202275-12-8 TaxID=3120159 RepID=UPI00300DB53B
MPDDAGYQQQLWAARTAGAIRAHLEIWVPRLQAGESGVEVSSFARAGLERTLRRAQTLLGDKHELSPDIERLLQHPLPALSDAAELSNLVLHELCYLYDLDPDDPLGHRRPRPLGETRDAITLRIPEGRSSPASRSAAEAAPP